MYGFRQFINDRGEDGQIINTYINSPSVKISEIANQFGKSQAEIYRILHAHDIPLNRLKIHHNKVHGLSHLGWGVNDIAEFTGYTPRNIIYILQKKLSEG